MDASMKKTAVLLIITLILSCCSMVALGDNNGLSVTPVTEFYEDGSELKLGITVSVEAPDSNAFKNRSVGLYLLRPNTTDSTILEYRAAYQGKFDKDGKCTIKFDFNDTPGYYTLGIITDTNLSKTIENFYIPDPAECNSFLVSVNKPDGDSDKITPEDMAIKIATNQNLTIDNTVFNQLSTTVQETICEQILGEVDPASPMSINELKDTYEEKLIIYGTRDSDGERVRKILEYYESDVNLSGLDIYTAYSGLNDKAFVFDMVALGSPADIPAIKTLFYESAFIQIIKEAVSYQNILSLSQTYRTGLGEPAFISQLEAETTYQEDIMDYVGERLSDVDDMTELNSLFTEAFGTDFSDDGETTITPSYPLGNNGGGGGGGGGATTVSPDFIKDEETAPPPVINTVKFNDLDSVKWAQTAILSLNEKGILLGDGSGNFRPNDNITRAEFIKIVVGAFDLEIYSQDEIGFSDVTENDWYFEFVKKAVSNGITNGKSVEYFGASDNITREEMFTLIYRTLTKLKKINPVETVTKKYSDFSSISEYAKNSILMLSEYKIANGFEDNTIRPKGNATRAEAAQLIFNVIGVI